MANIHNGGSRRALHAPMTKCTRHGSRWGRWRSAAGSPPDALGEGVFCREGRVIVEDRSTPVRAVEIDAQQHGHLAADRLGDVQGVLDELHGQPALLAVGWVSDDVRVECGFDFAGSPEREEIALLDRRMVGGDIEALGVEPASDERPNDVTRPGTRIEHLAGETLDGQQRLRYPRWSKIFIALDALVSAGFLAHSSLLACSWKASSAAMD